METTEGREGRGGGGGQGKHEAPTQWRVVLGQLKIPPGLWTPANCSRCEWLQCDCCCNPDSSVAPYTLHARTHHALYPAHAAHTVHTSHVPHASHHTMVPAVFTTLSPFLPTETSCFRPTAFFFFWCFFLNSCVSHTWMSCQSWQSCHFSRFLGTLWWFLDHSLCSKKSLLPIMCPP